MTKTSMQHLIEKILRMPESNIKNFLTTLGPEYLKSEKEQEYETKAFWFGRGILAGKENRIEELKPIKDNGEV